MNGLERLMIVLQLQLRMPTDEAIFHTGHFFCGLGGYPMAWKWFFFTSFTTFDLWRIELNGYAHNAICCGFSSPVRSIMCIVFFLFPSTRQINQMGKTKSKRRKRRRMKKIRAKFNSLTATQMNNFQPICGIVNTIII